MKEKAAAMYPELVGKPAAPGHVLSPGPRSPLRGSPAGPVPAIELRCPGIYAAGSRVPSAGDTAKLRGPQLREMIAAVEEARRKGYLSPVDANAELRTLRTASRALAKIGDPTVTVPAIIGEHPFPILSPESVQKRAANRKERQARKRGQPKKKRKSRKRRG